jgi:Xaa-Pro aminopeptidase
VAGKRYFTTGGALPTMRDSQSHLNTRPTGGQV